MKFLQDIALPVGDFEDGVQIDAHAKVGQGAEGNGHVDHADLPAAQGEREAVVAGVGEGGDAHGGGGGDKLLDAVDG